MPQSTLIRPRCARLRALARWLVPALLGASLASAQSTTAVGAYFGLTPPGETDAVFAPAIGVVPTHPAFSPDGKECIFSTGGRLFYTAQDATGAWSTPTATTFLANQNTFEPFFSKDGTTLFCTSVANGQSDIYSVTRTTQGWGTPTPLAAPFNSTSIEASVSQTTDGTFYFTSDRSGGFGGLDIYRARRAADQSWQVENLGAAINTAGIDVDPCVAPDERFVIVTKIVNGAANLTAYFNDRRGGWTAPVSLTGLFGNGYGPDISTDGRYFFYMNAAGTECRWIAISAIDKLNPLPFITAHPISQTVAPGGSATFSVTATGDAPLTYQWSKDGTALAGATAATLTLASLTAVQAGDYTVVVSNLSGSATSRLARLTVATPDPGRLSNLSVRSTAGTGGQPLMVGFVVSGGAKRLLVRAVGPTLTTIWGLAGTLADPRLDVHQTVGTTDTVVASNDNWAATAADQTALTAAFTSVGAFALPAASKDAALTLDVDGARTVHATGVPATTSGTVLVEAYDAGSGNAARLVNLSARNRVGTGADLLIAGFVISGNVPKKLFLRGIGPALTTLWGVTGTLADPLLELHTTLAGQDTVVASNDNWADEPGAADAMTAVGAYALPADSKDAALLVTLPAGTYTAQVSGVAATTGDAVVEVYEVP